MQQKHLIVRSWRLLRLLAPVLAVAFALMVVLPAFAETITNTTEPFSTTVSNPCNGEVVPVSGTFHDVFRVTLDGSGGFHLGSHENIHATGVGSLGNEYEVNATADSTLNAKVGAEETMTESVLFVSQGSAPNFVEKINFHITVNPDGTVTSFHEFISAECRG